MHEHRPDPATLQAEYEARQRASYAYEGNRHGRRADAAIARRAQEKLHLTLEFGMPVADRCRHGRAATTRPDLDNLAKAAADALTAPTARAYISALRKGRKERYEGVIADDARIVSMTLSKRWAPRPGGVPILLADAAAGEQFSSMSR